ncbi:MAG: cytidylate kinase-like family protein [Lachnospiraceae bacterium]|nr:cytidylate kinase-like family protein [Lachnospiraceae bacterium]
MKTIICISRQFASGGLEIGKILAERLDIPLYDSEIIDECVVKTGMNKELVHSHDEKASASLLYSIAMGYLGNHYIEAPGDAVFRAQAEAIRGFAEKGACIIVGRCAGEVLRDIPDCKRIFVYADGDFRQNRATTQYGCEQGKVKKILRDKDRERASYYTRYADYPWDSIQSFDLAINTACCGIEGAVSVISAFVECCEKG